MLPSMSARLSCAVPWCRLDLYDCSEYAASAVVSMLEQLPKLRAVKLGIHAGKGTEEDPIHPICDRDDRVELPVMAAVAALTELELIGAARLPPDWHQLSTLQRLRVVNGGQGSYFFEAGSGCMYGDGGEWSQDEWGAATLQRSPHSLTWRLSV